MIGKRPRMNICMLTGNIIVNINIWMMMVRFSTKLRIWLIISVKKKLRTKQIVITTLDPI